MFEETRRLVTLEKVKVSQESVLINNKCDKVRKILDKNSFNSIQALASLDVCEVISAYICAECNFNVDYDDIYDLFYENVDKLAALQEEEIFNKYFASSYSVDALDDEDFKNSGIDPEFLEAVKKNRKSNKKKNFAATINAISQYMDNSKIKDILCLTQVLYEFKDAVDDIKFSISNTESETGIRLKDKEKSKIIETELKSGFEINNIINSLSEIYGSVATIEKRNKGITTKINKILHDYELFLKKLTFIDFRNPSEIIDALKLCENDDIKKTFLIEYNDQVRKEFDTQKEKHDVLSNDIHSKYQVLLQQYGYNFNEFSDEYKLIISNKDFEEIKAILESISSFEITNNDMAYILCNTNLLKVKSILEYFSKGYFNLEFILSNSVIFNKDNTNLNDVVSLLNSYNINPQLFEKYGDLYLIDVNVLKENLSYIEGYNLLDYLKNSNNYSFLGVSDLCSRIDLFLELGYENFLVNNLNLLNYDVTRIKRLYLIKQIGYIPRSIEEINDVLSTDEFIIADEKIDEYLEDYSNLVIPDDIKTALSKKLLVRNTGTARTIVRNTSLCSKNRVFKNRCHLQNMEGLTDNEVNYYSYLYGKILTYSDYQKLINDFGLVENNKVL